VKNLSLQQKFQRWTIKECFSFMIYSCVCQEKSVSDCVVNDIHCQINITLNYAALFLRLSQAGIEVMVCGGIINFQNPEKIVIDKRNACRRAKEPDTIFIVDTPIVRLSEISS